MYNDRETQVVRRSPVRAVGHACPAACPKPKSATVLKTEYYERQRSMIVGRWQYRVVWSVSLALLGWSLAGSIVRAEDHLWQIDVEQAKAAAAKEGKDLLIEFTGSDWCPPCKQLAAKVLHSETFAKKIPQEFVLIKVDQRNDKSGQSEAEQKMVKQMLAKYRIEGFPTIMLCDAQGRPYASRVGYSGAPAEQYVKELIEAKQKRAQRDKLLMKASKAEGDAKAKLLDQALQLVGDNLMGYYSSLIDELVAADPDDSTGLKSKYVRIRADQQFDQALKALLQGLTSKDQLPAAVKKLDALLEEHDPSPELRQQSLYLKFRMLYESDKKGAREAIDAAIAADPKSAMARQLERVKGRAFEASAEQPKDEEKGKK